MSGEHRPISLHGNNPCWREGGRKKEESRKEGGGWRDEGRGEGVRR